MDVCLSPPFVRCYLAGFSFRLPTQSVLCDFAMQGAARQCLFLLYYHLVAGWVAVFSIRDGGDLPTSNLMLFFLFLYDLSDFPHTWFSGPRKGTETLLPSGKGQKGKRKQKPCRCSTWGNLITGNTNPIRIRFCDNNGPVSFFSLTKELWHLAKFLDFPCKSKNAR